jgi:RNA polymerase primary sigma factor
MRKPMTNDHHSLLDIYANEIEKYPLMKKEVVESLKVKDNSQLTEIEKDLLVTSNLRFVISEAKKFCNKNRNTKTKIDIMDLIQAGNLGLVDAVKKFDPSKGYCFITFARHDIRNRFLKSVNPFSVGNNIKVPSNSRYNRKLVFAALYEFKNEFGRDPTEDELSKKIGMKVTVLRKYLSDSTGQTSSLESMRDNSFFEPTDEDISEAKHSRREPIYESTISTIKNLMQDLPFREREIVMMRYFENRTLEDVANKFNITRERVRQIQFIALRKLKCIDDIKGLYYD